MCIGVWIWNCDSLPQYHLLLALNRDETLSRPTEAVHWWEDGEILGGKDCQVGGTWLASSRNGRVAFITNFREPNSISFAKSRGELVPRFLKCSKSPMEFAKEVAQEANEYKGFNLILMDVCTAKIAYVTNRSEGTSVSVQEVSPGLHVLCNALLDTPWQKAQRLRYKFETLLQQFGEDEIPETQIIENVMKDTVCSDRTMLPKTGYDPELEYKLSSIFVNIENENGPYGTRNMAVISLKKTGQLTFYEQYLEDGRWKEHKITYQIDLDKVDCQSKVQKDEKKGA